MGKLVRFGVSLDEELLVPFDQMCTLHGYSNRSEAIRDLIRNALLKEKFKKIDNCSSGILSIVYDHHKYDLANKVLNIQHEDFEIIITSVHVHLDHENCLEVLILKGTTERMNHLANKLISLRGIKHGTFTATSLGSDLV